MPLLDPGSHLQKHIAGVSIVCCVTSSGSISRSPSIDGISHLPVIFPFFISLRHNFSCTPSRLLYSPSCTIFHPHFRSLHLFFMSLWASHTSSLIHAAYCLFIHLPVWSLALYSGCTSVSISFFTSVYPSLDSLHFTQLLSVHGSFPGFFISLFAPFLFLSSACRLLGLMKEM